MELRGLWWTSVLSLAVPLTLRPYTQLEHQDPVSHTAQVYSCSQSPPPQFWDYSLSIQVFHRYGVHQFDCGDLICCSRDCWEKFPFVFSHSPWGSALDLVPPLLVGHLRVSVPHPDRMGLKEKLIRRLWLTQTRGRVGYRMWEEPLVAEV